MGRIARCLLFLKHTEFARLSGVLRYLRRSDSSVRLQGGQKHKSLEFSSVARSPRWNKSTRESMIVAKGSLRLESCENYEKGVSLIQRSRFRPHSALIGRPPWDCGQSRVRREKLFLRQGTRLDKTSERLLSSSVHTVEKKFNLVRGGLNPQWCRVFQCSISAEKSCGGRRLHSPLFFAPPPYVCYLGMLLRVFTSGLTSWNFSDFQGRQIYPICLWQIREKDVGDASTDPWGRYLKSSSQMRFTDLLSFKNRCKEKLKPAVLCPKEEVCSNMRLSSLRCSEPLVLRLSWNRFYFRVKRGTASVRVRFPCRSDLRAMTIFAEIRFEREDDFRAYSNLSKYLRLCLDNLGDALWNMAEGDLK